jgi:exopolysaccharide biosynthesis polyprenyl glycosylphosphotransferase
VPATRTARSRSAGDPPQRFLRAVEAGTARSAAAAVPKFGVGPKRQELLFAQSVLLADLGVLIASFFLAYLLRTRLWWTSELLPLREFVWVLGLIIVLWPMLARAVGLTDSHTYLWPRRMFLLTARVHVIGGLALLSTLYMLRAVEVSRLFMQTFLAISGVLFIAERAFIRRVMVRSTAGRSPYGRRTLVVGTTSAAAQFQRLLIMRPHWGSDIAGFLTIDGPMEQTFCDKPVLGRMRDLEALLDAMIVDDVVLAAPLAEEEVDRIVQTCAERGLTFHTLVHVPAPPQARPYAESLGNGMYLMSLERTPQSVVPLLVKRVIDVVGGFVGVLLFGIAYLICAPLIRFTSPGGAIFKHTRVGQNGRLFVLYKFRTMRSDAEAHKAALAGANAMRGHIFKLRKDPRVTRVGRVLRRFYLDELPQFWNVLKGDMSLVGPRPPLPEEVAAYAPYHRRRLSVRPGITGPWQARGNGVVADFEEIVRMECDYIDQWSLWLDILVMIRTCTTVARMAGQ